MFLDKKQCMRFHEMKYDYTDEHSLAKWRELKANQDTYREYEDERLVLAVKKPPVMEMKDDRR